MQRGCRRQVVEFLAESQSEAGESFVERANRQVGSLNVAGPDFPGIRIAKTISLKQKLKRSCGMPFSGP